MKRQQILLPFQSMTSSYVFTGLQKITFANTTSLKPPIKIQECVTSEQFVMRSSYIPGTLEV